MEQIKVKKIDEKTTKRGVVFWVIQDEEGEKYTAWDKEIVDVLKENIGKVINAEVKESNGFKNIRGLSVVEEKVGEVKESEDKKSGSGERDEMDRTERDKDIISQTIVKCATEIYKEQGKEKKEFLEFCKMVQAGFTYVRGKV